MKKSESSSGVRRPTGMNREVYALLYSDNKDRPSSPSLIPTDVGSGYRQPKARLGRKHVRPWKWMNFTNEARTVSELAKKSHNMHLLYSVKLYC